MGDIYKFCTNLIPLNTGLLNNPLDFHNGFKRKRYPLNGKPYFQKPVFGNELVNAKSNTTLADISCKKIFAFCLILIFGSFVILGGIISLKYFKEYLAVPQAEAHPLCTVNDDVTITGMLNLGTYACQVATSPIFNCADECEVTNDCPLGTTLFSCGVNRLTNISEFDTINCYAEIPRTCRCEVDYGGWGNGDYRLVNVCCF